MSDFGVYAVEPQEVIHEELRYIGSELGAHQMEPEILQLTLLVIQDILDVLLLQFKREFKVAHDLLSFALKSIEVFLEKPIFLFEGFRLNDQLLDFEFIDIDVVCLFVIELK